MPNENAERPQAKLVEIVKDEVFRLKVPMETPDLTGRMTVFSGSVNSYLVRARNGGWVVIDPGFFTETGAEGWNRAIRELSIGPGDIDSILVTHYHPDHAGMAGWFAQWTSAPIYMHPLDIACYDATWANSSQGVKDATRAMRKYGMDSRMAAAVEAQTKARALFVCYYSGFSPMEDGSAFPVREGALRAMHTPGHSDGQCVFLWPERNLLFAADLLLPVTFSPVSLHHFGNRNPVGAFLTTLERFSRLFLEGMTVLPGHGWPFEDPRGRARLQEEFYRKRIEWYYRQCAQGMDTAWQIALDHYKENGGKRTLRYIMGEAMAYMEYLAGEGRVTREARPDGIHFLV